MVHDFTAVRNRRTIDKTKHFFSPDEIMQRKFTDLGGEAFFGPPQEGNEPGKVRYFQNGCICFNNKRYQAFEIHGEIYKKWLQLGGLSWGLPCTDELPTPDGVGRYNHFNDNSASIYWTPGTGAWAIYGDIRKKWAALGWERSPLGYPTTDELGTPDGVGRFNHFTSG